MTLAAVGLRPGHRPRDMCSAPCMENILRPKSCCSMRKVRARGPRASTSSSETFIFLLNQQRTKPETAAGRARRCLPHRRWCAARHRASLARRTMARSTCSSPPRPRLAARTGLRRALAMRAPLQLAAMFCRTPMIGFQLRAAWSCSAVPCT